MLKIMPGGSRDPNPVGKTGCWTLYKSVEFFCYNLVSLYGTCIGVSRCLGTEALMIQEVDPSGAPGSGVEPRQFFRAVETSKPTWGGFK